MKILKEDTEREYKFKCYYSDGRNHIIGVKADDIITAWGNLSEEVRHWVMGLDGYLESVELMGDYSNAYDAYVNRR